MALWPKVDTKTIATVGNSDSSRHVSALHSIHPLYCCRIFGIGVKLEDTSEYSPHCFERPAISHQYFLAIVVRGQAFLESQEDFRGCTTAMGHNQRWELPLFNNVAGAYAVRLTNV